MTVFIIDNYDSFVYNLDHYVKHLNFKTMVFRNDKITIDAIASQKPSHIIISPGPCSPNEAGLSNDIIKTFFKDIPILGVCLGHQCIGAAFGASIIRSTYPMHGKTSVIKHNNKGIFKNLKNPLSVMRYHSLIIDHNLNDDIEITSTTDDNQIMAIQHRQFPLFGVQFHPESVLSEQGFDLLNNFLKIKS